MTSKANVHPKDKASFVSKVSLWWIVNLLWRGNLNPLHHDDLNPVREEERARSRIEQFEKIWKNEGKKRKLWKAMLKYFTWKEYASLCLTCLIAVLGNTLCIYSILKLIDVLKISADHGLQSRNHFLINVWGIIMGNLLECFGIRHFNLLVPALGIKSRAAIVNLIYQKVLKCSKMTLNNGEVMELVCNDTQQLIIMADRFLPFLIRKSANVVILVSCLLLLFGWKIVPGLFIIVLLSLFRIVITKIDARLRQDASQVAEKRLGYLRDVLRTINSVKLNCLEHIYESKMRKTRWEEIKLKAKRWIILSFTFSLATCGKYISTFLTVLIFISADSSEFTFQNLFAILLILSTVSDAIFYDIPSAIHFSTDILTGLTRIQHFLERHDFMTFTNNEDNCNESSHSEFVDRSTEDVNTFSCTPYVFLENVSCHIYPTAHASLKESGVMLLKDISFKISSKGLVIITGLVGSGKSSLLASILNKELHITKGTVKHFGKIAYVSDTPWVFSGTVRENILFGSAYDEKWYLQTIKACQLEKDFERFPEKDLSRIGEHGTTLSGGQRTRLALARAVYSKADIYLMDDPLSSLDANVSENIFKNVFKEMLTNRIVLLVGHKYLKEADYIIKLSKGTIVAQGPTEEVLKNIPQIESPKNKKNGIKEIYKDRPIVDNDDLAQAEQLREDEEDRQFGNVSLKVQAKYFMHSAPASILLLVLVAIGATQGFAMWIDIQVSLLPTLAKQSEKFHKALIVYPLTLIVAVLFSFVAQSCIFLLPIRANYKLHNKMVSSLLQAPTHFYTANPPGRILNRFSQDLNNLDNLLPYNLVFVFKYATLSLASITLCLASNLLLIPVIVITMLTCYGVSRFFFKPAMDIKRLMSQAGGPLYSHFSNTMEGLSIIRLHHRQKDFTDVLYNLIDRHHQAMYDFYAASRWSALSNDITVVMFLTIVSTMELYLVTDSSSVGKCEDNNPEVKRVTTIDTVISAVTKE